MNEWNGSLWKKIKVEGFQIPKLINLCIEHSIDFWDLQVEDECTLEGYISGKDLTVLRKLAGNRWKITELGETGLIHKLRVLIRRTATWTGLILFCGILYFQSLFISEIRIEGMERLTERQVREALEELGFYPGAFKSYDLQTLKTQLFHQLDQITWVGITYEGTVAKVKILEGTEIAPEEDSPLPVHVTADREGYLEKIMVKEGVANVKPGDYIVPGDVLISGEVPITSTTYGKEEEDPVRFVHAQGEVILRVLHRVHSIQERYATILCETKRWIPGISIEWGAWAWDSDVLFRPWNIARRKTVVQWDFFPVIPLDISLYQCCEVTIKKAQRTEEELRLGLEQQIRRISKEILPKDAQLIKKDLSFSEKENIIEMNVLLHSLEKTGVDAPIQSGTNESKRRFAFGTLDE